MRSVQILQPAGNKYGVIRATICNTKAFVNTLCLLAFIAFIHAVDNKGSLIDCFEIQPDIFVRKRRYLELLARFCQKNKVDIRILQIKDNLDALRFQILN